MRFTPVHMTYYTPNTPNRIIQTARHTRSSTDAINATNELNEVGVKFNKQPRHDIWKSSTESPGPAVYNTGVQKSRVSPVATFGRGNIRHDWQSRADSPGPAAYSPRSRAATKY